MSVRREDFWWYNSLGWLRRKIVSRRNGAGLKTCDFQGKFRSCRPSDVFEKIQYRSAAFYAETIDYSSIWNSIKNPELIKKYKKDSPKGKISLFALLVLILETLLIGTGIFTLKTKTAKDTRPVKAKPFKANRIPKPFFSHFAITAPNLSA